MRVRVLNLDGSLLRQRRLFAQYRPAVGRLEHFGPRIRLGCRFRDFHRFEAGLADATGTERDDVPWTTFYGSGDFHHVSLALVRRLRTPFNLLVFDNHPDWMRGVPVMHCGTWLYHAAQLPYLQRIFHVGGDVDFDNYYRWLAPWPLLEAGKIAVIPARRRYATGAWPRVRHDCVPNRSWGELLAPYRDELRRCPLYISVDKDVMGAAEAPVNWDSGHLTLAEVCAALRAFVSAADGNVAGMDIVGDWSPVRVSGLFRRFLHLTEHPPMKVDAVAACERNEQTNLTLLDVVGQTARAAWPWRQAV